ncbi:MAG: DUF2892 domain-containing protein [Candidatus Moranbacteria bacterium]|nr:DUF2892 domain-containing protein [Candidatus Moranbacteria bacterium]MDD3965092.1 DUF2892 domain-containing protein [Candidatus Moranbacteria bacterium]
MSLYRMDISTWSVERTMFAFGGLLVIIFSLLALSVNDAFVYGALFIGIMFSVFALTGYCPGAIIVAKILKK